MGKLHDLIDTAKKKYFISMRNRELAGQLAKVSSVNFHRRNRYNIGDLMCGPAEYFDPLKEFKMVEIFRCKTKMKLEQKDIIVGGGGLFSNEYFSQHLSHIVASNPKFLVCWGAGQNTHDSQVVSYPSILKDFDMVGIRDYNSPYEWVPCASCLHDVFNQNYTISRDIVLYNHYEFPSLKSYGIPEMENSQSNLEEIIKFLGSGETVLTTSYHGAYWATLLGRKVVVLNPFSSKFFAFRHPVEMASDNDWQSAIKRAVSYPEALEECRDRNFSFSKKVQERMAG